MTTEQQEPIIFLICDDEEKWRDSHRQSVTAALENFCDPIPHKFVTFNNDDDALDWMRAHGKKANVILITDGEIDELSGFKLLKKLDNIDLLPINCAICTPLTQSVYTDLKRDALIFDLTVHYIGKKGNYGALLGDFALAAVGRVAKAAGIVLPPREPLVGQPFSTAFGVAPR